MDVLRSLQRSSQDNWQCVSRRQIAFMDELMLQRSCLSSLLDRLENDLFSDGLLVMSSPKSCRIAAKDMKEFKRIMMIVGKHLLRACFVRHFAVIRLVKDERFPLVPMFLAPDKYDDIEFKTKRLSDVVQYRVVSDKQVVRKAYVVTGLAHQGLWKSGEVKTVPGLMYGAEMHLKAAETDVEVIRQLAARRDIRIQQDYPPVPTAAQINSGAGQRMPGTVGRDQKYPGVVSPEENQDLALAVQLNNPGAMADGVTDAELDEIIETARAAWNMPVRLIKITDQASQICGDELVVLKPGYSFASTPRPVVPSLVEDETTFERRLAEYSGFPRVFWSEATDVRGKTPSSDEEVKRSKFVRQWRDLVCSRLSSICQLMFAADEAQDEVLEVTTAKAVVFVLPAAYNMEEIKQLGAKGVIHEDEICELMAGRAGWEGGEYDFKARMKNLDETAEAARAEKSAKEQAKTQRLGGGGLGKRKEPPGQTKEDESKQQPAKKKAKTDKEEDDAADKGKDAKEQ